MLRKTALVGAIMLAAMLQPGAAPAAEGYLFSIWTSASSPVSWVKCNGPWFRVSACQRVTGGTQRLEFYTAESNLFSLFGQWQCRIYSKDTCHVLDVEAFKQFCIPAANSGSTGQVWLDYDNSRSYHERLRIDLPDSGLFSAPETCPATLARSVLGQDGEDAESRRDVDSYTLDGRSGENVKFVLAIDGASGGINGDATLRVLDLANTVLAQKKGRLPLQLDATLNGPALIQVIRDGSPSAFRGFYTIEVVPASGDLGERKLRPTQNVEQ